MKSPQGKRQMEFPKYHLTEARSGLTQNNQPQEAKNIGGVDGENNPEAPTDLQPSEWNGKYDVKFTRLMPGEVPNRDNDWFELSNLGDEVANLTGWTIERIRSTTPWISTFNELVIPAGGSIVLTENTDNLFLDGGISAIDGNVVMNNMPWLVDSGSALQLKSPDGTVVDAVVYWRRRC